MPLRELFFFKFLYMNEIVVRNRKYIIHPVSLVFTQSVTGLFF